MTRDSKESVISRWSRRKLETQQVQETPPAVEPEARELDADTQLTEPEQKPALTDADMPDIETLTEDSDYSGFMSQGVSDELRNLALRKLFRSSVFNIRDGLDEYDEDYTYFEKLGDVVTSDMKHQVEMQQQKLREAMQAEADAVDDDLEALEDDEVVEEDAEVIAEAQPESEIEAKDEQ